MNSFAFIALGILAVALLLVLFTFRFLLYPFFPSMNPIKHATHLALSGPTLFISDLHLTADQPFPYSKSLRQVMEARSVSNLMIVGDLFDSPEDAAGIIADGAHSSLAKILGVEGLPIRVFFVYGSPPHDPSPQQNIFENTPITPLGKCAILNFGSIVLIAYHGHDLSEKGAIGHAWDRFVSPLSLERAWKRIAGVQNSDWVIFGHTHLPGIDAKHRLANCGGWQRKKFLVQPACTGLMFSAEKNGLEIVHFA